MQFFAQNMQQMLHFGPIRGANVHVQIPMPFPSDFRPPVGYRPIEKKQARPHGRACLQFVNINYAYLLGTIPYRD